MSSPPPAPARAPTAGLSRKIVLVMLLAVLLYGAYAVYVGANQIASALASFQWSAFVLALLLAFGNYLLRFLKWEFYLARLQITGIPKRESLLVFLSGFVLTVTPGKIGEVFKSALLAERRGIPMERTAPIVIADRITDVIGIAALIAVGSLGFSGGLIWAVIGLSMVGSLVLVVSSRRLSLGLLRLCERGPAPLARMVPKLSTAYESLAVLVRPRNLLVPAVISILAWSLECLALWVILRGFGQATAVSLCFFFYATSTLAGAIVPTPGGLGVTETLLQQGLSQLGQVPEVFATAAMMLVRFATLWFAVLVGFVALSLLRTLEPPTRGAKG